jgi:hypothetical protein
MSYRLVPCDETCHEKDTENGYVTPSEFHWEEITECGCELGVYACSEAHAKEMSV